MTIPEMQRRVLSDLDETRADVIRYHHDGVLSHYHEGFRDALEYVARAYLGIGDSVLGDNPSWKDDADAGRNWDKDGDKIADAYLEACAQHLPQRLAALEARPSGDGSD